MHNTFNLKNYVPLFQWTKGYNQRVFSSDLIAAIIVTFMLIPQSLAYALLAGLPAEMGLYASILPLVAYAIFGTSRTLSVGPVAVVSLMTATAIAKVTDQHAVSSADVINIAIILAFLSGVMLVIMGALKFGFLANFLSHPVIAGFISASGLVIAASQLTHILGIDLRGIKLTTVVDQLSQVNVITMVIGFGSLLFLFWARREGDQCRSYSGLKPLLHSLGFKPANAAMLTKASPVLVVFITTYLAYWLDLEQSGLAIVGSVPQGLPSLYVPEFSISLWSSLSGSALLIATIGYVESVSVGKTLAAKRRQRIDPNQELIGLGAANVASAMSAGFPVTGGFSRSIVNFDAGAQTPAASIFTAIGIALAAMFLTPFLYYLPKATLAATIIVAVLSLVDFSIIKKAWSCSTADFIGFLMTAVVTLLLGVEMGVISGVLVSIGIHLYKTSRPHMAVVGEVPGTEHFRNVLRHDVITYPNIISLRIDQSLYFANAAYLEDKVYSLIDENPNVKHIVIVCSAINEIDMSALEVLEMLNERLKEFNVSFNFSEIKGPVMDFLDKTDFVERLNGRVFLTQKNAMDYLVGGSQCPDKYH